MDYRIVLPVRIGEHATTYTSDYSDQHWIAFLAFPADKSGKESANCGCLDLRAKPSTEDQKVSNMLAIVTGCGIGCIVPQY